MGDSCVIGRTSRLVSLQKKPENWTEEANELFEKMKRPSAIETVSNIQYGESKSSSDNADVVQKPASSKSKNSNTAEKKAKMIAAKKQRSS